MVATLEPDARTLHGWFDRDLPPVLTVDPGTTVRFGTLDSGWHAGPYQGGAHGDRLRVPEHTPDAGHALTGPVAALSGVPCCPPIGHPFHRVCQRIDDRRYIDRCQCV